MKIQSYDLSMQSQHTFSQSSFETQVSFSTFLQPQPMVRTPEQNMSMQGARANPKDYNINSMIQNLLHMLNGRAGKKVSIFEDNMSNGRAERNIADLKAKMFTTRTTFKESYRENESLDFSTIGRIQTDSGYIDLDVNFSMSRSFVIENNIDVHTSFDPLIINVDGDIPALSSDTFSFDLDNDGEEDQISKLKEGNGFLAYDENEDGVINKGSELFGTVTGNGFEELRAYDRDENNWIDESDAIFDKLRVWFKNEESSERELVGLGEIGVGAIYLNSTESEFTYKTEKNETLGELKSCSFFLNEDGTCGNISQIDLAKSQEPLAQALQA